MEWVNYLPFPKKMIKQLFVGHLRISKYSKYSSKYSKYSSFQMLGYETTQGLFLLILLPGIVMAFVLFMFEILHNELTNNEK